MPAAEAVEAPAVVGAAPEAAVGGSGSGNSRLSTTARGEGDTA